MIIVGYQGIGKSTLAANDLKYIDLESSNFFIGDKRAEDWYIPYCNIAEHLSEQGYNVFVSSHAVVRQELKNRTLTTLRAIVCPDPELEDLWVEKLRLRYEQTLSNKDYKAYMNATDRYAENIKELMSESGFIIKLITKMDYNLREVIENYNV